MSDIHHRKTTTKSKPSSRKKLCQAVVSTLYESQVAEDGTLDPRESMEPRPLQTLQSRDQIYENNGSHGLDAGFDQLRVQPRAQEVFIPDPGLNAAIGLATNTLESINFIDVTANLSSKKFFRALPQDPAQ